MAAKKSTKNNKGKAPRIDPEEIERLRRIAEYEDDLEDDIQSEVRAVRAERDRRTARQLKKLKSKNKKMAMWASVSAVMLVIVSLWVMNIDVVVKQPIAEAQNSSTVEELKEMREDLDKKLDQVVEDIEALQQRAKAADSQSPEPEAESSNNNEEQLIR